MTWPIPIMSLRSKIVLGTAGIVVALGLVIISYTNIKLHGMLNEKLMKRGISIARHIAVNSADNVLTEKYFQLQLSLADLKKSEEDISYIFIVDSTGSVIAHTFEEGFPHGLRRVRTPVPPADSSVTELLLGKEETLDISVPILAGEAGFLHLGLSAHAINRDLGNVITVIAWFIAATLIIGTVTAIIFSRAITTPLAKLSSAAKAVGHGDFDQKVEVSSDDEVGQLAEAFNRMVEKRRKVDEEKARLITELQGALAEIKTLSGFLPICASCKKVRDDKGYWSQIEQYISDHSDARFSHGICPDCARSLYPEFIEKSKPATETDKT